MREQRFLYEHSDVEVPESCSCFARAFKVLIFTMTVELMLLALVTVVMWSTVDIAEEGPYTQQVPAQEQHLVKTGGQYNKLSVCVYILITVGVLGLVVVGVWLCWVYAGQLLHHVEILFSRRAGYEEIHDSCV